MTRWERCKDGDEIRPGDLAWVEVTLVSARGVKATVKVAAEVEDVHRGADTEGRKSAEISLLGSSDGECHWIWVTDLWRKRA